MKITVCGSIAFYTQMEQLRDELVALGHEVKIPQLSLEAPKEFGGGRKIYLGSHIDKNGGMDAFPAGHSLWSVKEKAIKDHFEKIDWCDVILVSNHEKRGVHGYIGGNTLIEIGLAFYLGKKIYILNDISNELRHKQEILGMKPTILHGDINLLAYVDAHSLV